MALLTRVGIARIAVCESLWCAVYSVAAWAAVILNIACLLSPLGNVQRQAHLEEAAPEQSINTERSCSDQKATIQAIACSAFVAYAKIYFYTESATKLMCLSAVRGFLFAS
jgi:hypothetical protein